MIEAEDMPDIGAGTTPIAFGDFAGAVISWWIAPGSGSCAIRIRPSPMCCSIRPSESAAACRIFAAIKLMKCAA